MKRSITITAALLLILFTTSSCSSYTATGAGFGAVIGSAIGGIAGGPRGSDIGTLVGMATGAAVGAAAEANEDAARERAALRAERRYRAYERDDTYYNNGTSRSAYEREKAARVRKYHDRAARRYSGTGYSIDLPQRSGTVTRSTEPQYNTRESVDTVSKTDTPQYDDRIEMK